MRIAQSLDWQQIKILRLVSRSLCKSLSSILFQASKLSNENITAANTQVIAKLIGRDSENIFELCYNVSWPDIISPVSSNEVDSLNFNRLNLIENRTPPLIKALLAGNYEGTISKLNRLKTISVCLEPADYTIIGPYYERGPAYTLQTIRHTVTRNILNMILSNRDIMSLKLEGIELSIYTLPGQDYICEQHLPVEWLMQLELLQIEFTSESFVQRKGHHRAFISLFDSFWKFLVHARSLKSLTLKYPFDCCPLTPEGQLPPPDQIPSHFDGQTTLNKLRHLEVVQS